jgi:hypothetical protein
MIFSPCFSRHSFFWAKRKGIVVFVGKKKHTHTPVFLDEEKEKARVRRLM